MGELLPTVAARTVQEGLLDYLDTTFALSDPDARAALRAFLAHPDHGVFKGPYIRLRLPFRPADEGWRDLLGWHPLDDGAGFAPYRHQAAAFARLSTLDQTRPRPTIVTTGTGSGKTEAFLYPILDHVLRAKARGDDGVKALIVYPMNALANDQALRLARLICDLPSLRSVTAGIYTGETEERRTIVTPDGLINDRAVLRDSPPDILLTNYKMLDQLLLRAEDARIWSQSARSLQYLVLDEFHTYDGAQGTDVAMLLRRLGLTLKAYGAAGERPLAHVTPVATSATLGDRGDPGAILRFAETVFGEALPSDTVITEERVPLDEWVAAAPADDGLAPRDGAALAAAVRDAAAALGADPEPAALAAAVLRASYDGDLSGRSAAALVRAHPFTRRLLAACEQAVELRALAGRVLPDADPDAAAACVTAYVGLLSHVRATEGRAMPQVEVHLWVRELTRVNRRAESSPAFAWSDDGTAPLAADADDGPGYAAGHAFPAIYCRHCGRSGWGVRLSPASDADLAPDDDDIRASHLRKEGRFRPLLLAAREAWERTDEPPPETLRWFSPTQRRITPKPPEAEARRGGTALPVLTHVGPDADDEAREDTCPACLQRDGIRFLGSAIATQLSVAISTLFGSVTLRREEKKTLVFTDSVQDAAHRAGFIQARSRSLTLRSVLREAIGDEPHPLSKLADRMIEQAGDDPVRRYRLLPPDLADAEGFRAFWETPRLARVSTGVTTRVSKRLAFDAALEFGLQSRLGRTLELSGTVAVEVEVPPALLTAAARRALEAAGGQLSFDGPDERRLRAWARGVLERMRERGAIHHPWLDRFIRTDGSRHAIWRGRNKREGMPAFPRGRPAPAFPRVGPKVRTGRRQEDLLDPVTSPQSWYARWTARALAVSAHEGASLARSLLEQLAGADLIMCKSNDAGATVYALDPDSIRVEPVADAALAEGRHLLVCDVCQNPVPGTATVVDELEGAPCLGFRCDGRLVRAPADADNFYRRFYTAREVQRVIAREHTALLGSELRSRYERGFKGAHGHPDAPNVLVATPTLEMGIDIGDLSSVMLASLPRQVASYLQRVGRAGRLSGSALNLVFVAGRGDQLPRLGEPLSMINGSVRPPATYLDAEELLRRQYVAALGDAEARAPDGVHPTNAAAAMADIEPGSYLHALATRGEQDRDFLETFLAAFPHLTERARESMRRWVAPVDGEPLTSPLAQRLRAACQQWRAQIELLTRRRAEIIRSLPELERRARSPAAVEDDERALKAARASLKLARGQLRGLRDAYWVAVLERFGLFPNYTLLDDDVTLDVAISWLDPDSGEFVTEAQAYHRSAAQALREFAPGATFYTHGQQLRVNAIDLGDRGESVRRWAWCPACGFGADVTERRAPSACPRCGAPGIADLAQQLEVVELTRASSSMRRDEATIDDARDERERQRFAIALAVDVPPDGVTREWYAAQAAGFGVKHVRDLTLRWLNLGRAPGHGSTRRIAGRELVAELFRVCAECGQLDQKAHANARYEHRPWCSLRDAPEERTRSIALMRTLTTEGLLLRLPPMTSVGSSFALPSLSAAIMRGLREHLGGAPDHLAIEAVVDPAPGHGTAEALLIHDLVPGGTGYLIDLAEPRALWDVLHRAYEVVRDCTCRESNRRACPHCLLPFAPVGQGHLVARAEAEKQLLELLAGGDAAALARAAGPAWTLTERSPAAIDLESMLERKFRAVFRERLDQLGATVHVEPRTVGERWRITLNGRTWTLDPQVMMGHCKPDFVLRCDDPHVPQVAIFCDGWRYHASPANNRLADDARKRALLRDEDVIVLALSWADLDEAAADDGHPWLVEDAIPHLLQMDLGLTRRHVELLRGGPLDLLVAWVQAPDPDGLRAIGRAVPFIAAAASSHRGALPDGEPPAVVAARMLADADGSRMLDGDGTHAWAWRMDGLVLLARVPQGAREPEVALVLDDDADALGDGRRAAWETWLRLANLLGARSRVGGPATQITVRSSAAEAAELAPSVDGGASDGEALDPAWAALLAQATAEEARFLVQLARAGLPRPELGPEVDGIPLGPSWPERQVTLDLGLGLGDDERAALERRGWVVVEADVDAVRAVLEGGS